MALFHHLAAMTAGRGLLEHADGARPRLEHGYCTDDNARLLAVASREIDAGVPAVLSRVALAFTLDAQHPDGRVRNRMSQWGVWTDAPSTDDCWGRSIWGLGVAASQHGDPAVRAAALSGAEIGLRQRSRWPRAMAFAALGAAEVVSACPDHALALAMLTDAAGVIGAPRSQAWCWPEARLTYANAALAEAVLAAGAALSDAALFDRGLAMLSWLFARESRAGHVSVTGTAGSDASTIGPQFDQQPIEVAALADACWRAYTLTGEARWAAGVALAASWYAGANDVGVPVCDPATGAGYDGLTPYGVNLNRGAESTLAYVSCTQRARLARVGA